MASQSSSLDTAQSQVTEDLAEVRDANIEEQVLMAYAKGLIDAGKNRT